MKTVGLPISHKENENRRALAVEEIRKMRFPELVYVEEGYGEALVTALKKLAKENFSHLSPSKINVLLEYSHPPLGERISAIESAKE